MRAGEEDDQRRVALALAHLCPPHNNAARFANLYDDSDVT